MDSLFTASLIPVDSWQRLMVDALWLSTVVGLLGLVSAYFFSRRPAAKAWLLLIALSACVFLPMTNFLVRSAGWGIPIQVAENEPVSQARPIDFVNNEPASNPEVLPLSSQPYSDNNAKHETNSESQLEEANSSTANVVSSWVPESGFILKIIGCIWLGLSAFLVIRLLASAAAVYRIARFARPCTEVKVLNAVSNSSRQVGLATPPRILVSDQIESPMVLAFLRPALLVPETALIHGDRKNFDAILSHELAHIKRRDGWARCWIQIVAAILPMQPLVWLMKRSFFAAVEEACDDLAVANGSDPVDLAAVLTHWCDKSNNRRDLMFTVGMSATRSRIIRLLNDGYSPLSALSMKWRLCASIITLIVGCGLSFAQLTGEADETTGPQDSVVLSGNDNVSGTCVDENNQPIPNARVRVFRIETDPDDSEMSQTELNSITADEKGRFTLQEKPKDLGKFAYMMVVAQHLEKATTYKFVEAASFDGQPIRLQLRPAGTLRGRVLDTQGSPVKGAVVSMLSPLLNPVEGICAAISNADGFYEITDLPRIDLANQKPQPWGDGTVSMVSGYSGDVQHPHYARDRFAVTRVPAVVDVNVQSAAIVEGTLVLKESGKPAVGAQIEFWNDNIHADHWTRATTDNKGYYKIESLPPGTYRVGIQTKDRPNLFLPAVELVAGKNRKDVPVERGGIVKGRVVNVFTKKPIRLDAEETMQLIEINPNGISHMGMPMTHINPDGSFELLMPAGRRRFGMYIGKNWRGVHFDRFRKEGVEVVEGETTEIEIRVKPAKKPDVTASSNEPRMDVPTRAAVAAIKQLGGWVKLETIGKKQHVIEVNMVYNEDEETGREDNDLIFDECLSYATKFPKLKRLLLKKEQATDTALAKLVNLENLEEIHIWNASAVSDAGTAHLAKLKSLKSIFISNSNITDKSLRSFSSLPRIENLSLPGNQFTDKGLENIQHMSRLTSLWLGLGKNEITDDGLQFLAKLTNLETLDLQHSKITDDGLTSLHSLKKLRNFHYSGSGVTKQGFANLQKELPKLQGE